MSCYEYEDLCLVPQGGRLPAQAVEIESPSPLTPRVLLVERDPKRSRCLSANGDPCCDWHRLLPQQTPAYTAVLNTAFRRCYTLLPTLRSPKTQHLRLTLVGLGDVGSTLLTALKLLGDYCIDEIGIYDPYTPLIDRYLLELNQVLYRPCPRIVRRSPDALFDCDVFLFAASAGVPPVGAAGDMRMQQFAKNRALLQPYAKMARDAGFSGLFCQISDPVDLLCRCVFLQSNRNEAGAYDWKGLLPEQIVGFGLGVMAARAQFMAARLGLEGAAVEVFGPHGADLVVANDLQHYDETLSAELTRLTVGANHEVRALGFKPYLAPALSSACLSLLRLLRGEEFYGAIPLGGVYFGCRARRGAVGIEPVERQLPAPLQRRIAQSWQRLKEMDAECEQSR